MKFFKIELIDVNLEMVVVVEAVMHLVTDYFNAVRVVA